MPSLPLETYADLKRNPALQDKKLHKVMDVFMDREGECQREIKQHKTLPGSAEDKKGSWNNCRTLVTGLTRVATQRR